MEIRRLFKGNFHQAVQGAVLLRQAFPHAYGKTADDEMRQILGSDRVAFGAFEDGELIGFVGAIPQYETTGWELHPLVVAEQSRREGIGSALVEALEAELKELGCVTVYLGCDDEDSGTTLSDIDLFDNTFEKIKDIQNLKSHPFEFYRKLGYQIVGVIPDANGIGKPDIWMAKSLIRQA